MTLAFLGWTAPERVASAWDAAETAADGHPPARLSFVSVKAVPPRRPRLFAVDLGDEGGRAGALHAALSDALQAAGLYEPERRAFWPHVTVARVRRGGRAAAPTAAPLPGEAFDAPSLTLYRSELSPAGARYTVLERLELRGR